MRPTISAYIYTHNEEKDIADCIRSVAWCDEVIVVDAHSSDRTVEIARALGARVALNEWKGFREQSQFALSQVRSEWALNVDADERVSTRLRQSIERAIQNPDPGVQGYRVTRMTYHLGRFFRRGTLFVGVTRLGRTDRCRWAGDNPHTFLDVDGKVGRLDGVLVHLRNRDLDEQHRVYNLYSTQKAEAMWARGVRAGAWSIVIRPLARFVKSYVLKRGFRMGVAGLVAALEEASYDFYKYAKIWEKEIVPEPQDLTAFATFDEAEAEQVERSPSSSPARPTL